MKKLLLIALLLGLFAFAFTACGGNNGDDEPGYTNGQVDPIGGTPTPPDPTPTPPAQQERASRASILAGLEGWPAPYGNIIVGMATRPDVNILSSDWTNTMPNARARDLMFTGLGTMSRNHFNQFFPNPMVMVDGNWPQITDNADGSRTYRFTIYTENQFSDGSFINAYHYAGGIALSISPQWAALVASALSWNELAYRQPFHVGEIDVLPSVRVYSPSEFSLTIRADYIPNVWESALFMNVGPTALHMYGIEAHDNGDGVFLVTMGRDYFCGDALHSVVEGGEVGHYLVASIDEDGNNVYSLDTDGNRVMVRDGIRYHPTVFSGPYMFESVDVGNGTISLLANPFFPGTWDGYRPRIERIVLRLVPADLMVDALATGEADVLIDISDGGAINSALDVLVGGGTHTFINYEGLSQTFVQFHTDTGPTQFRNVRQAITFLMDRHEINEFVGQGMTSLAHGMWAPAWWWYQEAANLDLYDRITIYDLNIARAMQLLAEDGWNYNADGSPWVHGSGEIRHRWVDDWDWGVFPEGHANAGQIQRVLSEFETNEEGELVAGDLIGLNKVYTGERVLMPLIINWMVRDIHYPLRDAIEMQLPYNLEYVGGLLIQQRNANWSQYLTTTPASGFPDTRFEMHALGVGFATVWSPWHQVALSTLPAQNWGMVDCQTTRDLADNFRAVDLTAPGGPEAFIEFFIQYFEHLTYEAFTIPMTMGLNHDFFPLNLGGWYNNSFWQMSEALQRAYWRR